MRAASLILLAACTSSDVSSTVDASLTVDVTTSPTGVYWYISPGTSCTCQNVATFPANGACTYDSDTPGCTCYPGACLTRVDLLHAGAVIGGVEVGSSPIPITSDGFPGDFTRADLALRFVGCGDDAVAPLTNTFPEMVPMTTVSADTQQVSWTSVANDGFLVSAAGEYTGELCHTQPGATSQSLDRGYYPSVYVGALLGPTLTTAAGFTFHMWSTN